MTGDEAAPGQIPALRPCPACGGWAQAVAVSSWWVQCGRGPGNLPCWRGPSRASEVAAVVAWNALPRLVDGLRPEAAESAETGFALLDEAARHALEDTAETVLWLRRAVTTFAERHGVKLPPTPKTRKDPT